MTQAQQVTWSYLPRQFQEIDAIVAAFKTFVPTGDFTLGQPLQQFEATFAKLMNARFAIGVNSGTDAIKLSLKVIGIKPGDEVITAAHTFVATVGAIHELGAVPILVDCQEDGCMSVADIASKITRKTKAIVPVHWGGQMVDMPALIACAEAHHLPVIEDACQAMFSEINQQKAGSFGKMGCFSLHPLKAINVWGDGGVIVTDDEALNERLRLYRNHGLKSRDEVVLLGYNSRLDTLQAIVGLSLLPRVDGLISKRIENLRILDEGLSQIPEIRLPPRYPNRRLVCHLYVIYVEQRDALYRYCLTQGVEVKIHYPKPLYQQPGLAHLGYRKGDFPVIDRHAETMISLPMHQHHTSEEMAYVVKVVSDFYKQQRS